MAPPKIHCAVSKFYFFPEDAVRDGYPLGVDYDIGKGTDSYEDIPKTLADVRLPAPFIIGALNLHFRNLFAGKDHIVTIRLDNSGEYYYVLEWNNGKRFRELTLVRFDENRLPMENRRFLFFDIGKRKASVLKKGESQVLSLKDETINGELNRFLVIPVDSYESYINANELVNTQLHFKGYMGQMVYTERIRTENGDKTNLYLTDFLPMGVKGKTELKVAKVKEKPTVNGFAAEVVHAVKAGFKPGGKTDNIALFFVVDNSHSMGGANRKIMFNISKIVSSLKESETQSLKIGLITFNNTDSIDETLPLTEMDNEGINSLISKLLQIKFYGGEEPVGEATIVAIDRLKNISADAKAVFVLTDDDGCKADEFEKPYYRDAVRLGKSSSIEVSIKTEFKTEFGSINDIKNDAELLVKFATRDSILCREAFEAGQALANLGDVRSIPTMLHFGCAGAAFVFANIEAHHPALFDKIDEEYVEDYGQLIRDVYDESDFVFGGAYLVDYIFLIVMELGLDPKEARAVTRELMCIARESGSTEYTVYSLSRFAFAANDFEYLKKYLPLIKEVKTVVHDYDKSISLINLISDFAANKERSFQEVIKYKDALLKKIGCGGKTTAKNDCN